jgi:hypothetical protein
VSDLERELRILGAAVAWPPTPDAAGAVAARLAASQPAVPRWWRRRRVLVVALAAALLTAVAATMAVPPARSAVLRWLGIGSVRVVEVDELPSSTAVRPFPGRPATLAEARAAVPFQLLEPPPALGPPTQVLLFAGDRAVTLVWGSRIDPRLAVTQLPGGPAPWLLKKIVAPTSPVQQLGIDGRLALWIGGGPHEVAVVDPVTGKELHDSSRLAGHTLLVDHGDVTLRIEGALTRDRAVEIAGSFG